MESKNSIQKHAIIAGILVSAFFSFIIFSKHYLISLCAQICDFGFFWNPIFWGILFPFLIVCLFSISAKKINNLLNHITYFKACSQFSLQVGSKLIIILFAIYIGGLIINGISSVLHWQIQYQILFSLVMILFLSLVIMILTFISSLIIVKASQNTQTLNQTK
jgi:hypothetical protein